MKYFKKVIGSKCYLSPINVDDAEKYTEWLSDSELSINLLFSGQIISIGKEKEILERLSKSNNHFAIIDLETDELLGNCGLENVDMTNRNAEVGIFIGDKENWSKGYGTEALKLLLDFAFNIRNLNNVILHVFAFNERAIKSYKKIGFKEIGRRRKSYFAAGKYHDEISMDILSDEYQSIYYKDVMDSVL